MKAIGSHCLIGHYRTGDSQNPVYRSDLNQPSTAYPPVSMLEEMVYGMHPEYIDDGMQQHWQQAPAPAPAPAPVHTSNTFYGASVIHNTGVVYNLSNGAIPPQQWPTPLNPSLYSRGINHSTRQQPTPYVHA